MRLSLLSKTKAVKRISERGIVNLKEQSRLKSFTGEVFLDFINQKIGENLRVLKF